MEQQLFSLLQEQFARWGGTGAFLSGFGLALLFWLAARCAARKTARERALVREEVRTLLSRIEVLTTSSRVELLRNYDALLTELSRKASEEVQLSTSDQVFALESAILRQLSEVDPELLGDQQRTQLDELIRTMEALEQRVANCARDAVLLAIAEHRNRLSAHPLFEDVTRAA